MSTPNEIGEQALALTAEERAEIEKAWTEEIERRVAAYDRGELGTRDAADVFEEARRISR